MSRHLRPHQYHKSNSGAFGAIAMIVGLTVIAIVAAALAG